LGWDLHSREALADDLFVNVAEHDYRLCKDSPAIGAGKALPDVTDDILGRPRSEAPDDVGCYAAGECPS